VLNGQKTALSHKIVWKEKEPKEMLKASPNPTAEETIDGVQMHID